MALAQVGDAVVQIVSVIEAETPVSVVGRARA